MRKIFAFLLMAMVGYSTVIAAETSKVKLRVYRDDGQAYEFLVSRIDSLKFVVDDEETKDSRDYIVDGALTAASFKVSDSTSVYFSQGNLQFSANKDSSHAVLVDVGTATVPGVWRFAENQYDVIGEDNQNIAEDYEGWIDLFGWGTSGWNSGATEYQPWSSSLTWENYVPGGNIKDDSTGEYINQKNNLTGDYAKADWGVYNAISNGGNTPNKWRTLTVSEWQYLFQNNKWTLGYVKTSENDSVLCFMFVPEFFVGPEDVKVTLLSTTTSSLSMGDLQVPATNNYTVEQFKPLEKSGIVALPCGGMRRDTTVYWVSSYGHYWSSSAEAASFIWEFLFWFEMEPMNTLVVIAGNSFGRSTGMSVRLVQDIP